MFLFEEITIPRWLYFHLPFASATIGLFGIFNSIYTTMTIISYITTFYGVEIIRKRFVYNFC